MEEAKKQRKSVDWEGVEREYRAGIRSLRDIADEFGITETAIRKKAKKEEWTRDLSAKVKAKADELVRKEEVRSLVRAANQESEREQINVSAQMLADKLLNQREDIQRARAVVNRLWKLVEDELSFPGELSELGKMLRQPDDFGNDKLNDMYFAVLSVPQQVKNVKLLADAIKTLIELERKVLRIDTMPDPDPEEESRKAIANAGRAAAAGIDEAMRALAATVAERQAKKQQ